MKKLTLVLSVVCVVTACEKKDVFSPIVGNWKWVNTASNGVNATPQNTGKTWNLNFNHDQTYDQSGNLYPVDNGTYLTNSSEDSIRMISSSGDTTSYKYTIKSNDTLLLSKYSIVDSPIHYFVRY